MSTPPQSPGPEASPGEQDPPLALDELKAWMAWVQQAAGAADTLSRLAALELRLAINDGKRLLLLGLVMVPLVLLAWTGLSVLLAWLAYQQGESVTLGLCAFLAVQLVALAAILKAFQIYRRSLTLPATRSHIQAFMEGTRHGSPTTDR